MNNIFVFFSKHKTILVLLILFFLSFLSHGKTMQMYYWVDDWAMNYKILWPEESPGNMGAGIYGNGGPYRYLVTPFIWLYPLFHFNAFPYFAIGWFLFVIAGFSVFLLTKEFTQKYWSAVCAAGIFTSGFIGAHALYRLTNSYQTVGATIFICLTVLFFAKFLRTQNLRFYWVTLILFIISIEIFFIRTHGLLLSLFGVSLCYVLNKTYKGSIKNLVYKLLPFSFIFYYMYFLDPRILVDSKLVLSGMEAIFKNGDVALFNNLFVTFGNIFIPDQITSTIYLIFSTFSAKQVLFKSDTLSLLLLLGIFVLGMLKKVINNKPLVCFPMALIIYFGFVFWSGSQSSSLWTPRGIDLFTSLLGFSLLISFLFIAFINYKKNITMSLLVPLSIYWILVNSVTLFIYSPWTNLESTSRYFVPAFAGVGILYTSVFTLLFKRKLFIFPIMVVVITLLYFSNKEEDTMLRNISKPDKQGYNLILSEVKNVDKNTLFYIDTEDDPKFKNTYLGRLPQLGISALFNYHGITQFAESYDDLFTLLKQQKTDLNNVQTYFFGRNGYVSTSNKVRELFANGGVEKSISGWHANIPTNSIAPLSSNTLLFKNDNRSLGVNPIIETDVSYDSVVPSMLTLTLSAKPITGNQITFPYFDISKFVSSPIDNKVLETLNPQPLTITKEQILSVARQESERFEFYKSATAVTTSSWKGTEVKYLVDNRDDTNWGAENNQWNTGVKPQEVVVDMGKSRIIRNINWTNHFYMTTPTVYLISTSLDGVNWSLKKEVKDLKRREAGEKVTDSIVSTQARFIKFSVNDTYGSQGYPPALNELWVGNEDGKVDDIVKQNILDCPFCYIKSQTDYDEILPYLKNIAKIRVSWQTDRADGYSKDNFKDVPVIYDGIVHTYNIVLPAQGTHFNKIKIDGFKIPLKLEIKDAKIRSLLLKEVADKYDK